MREPLFITLDAPNYIVRTLDENDDMADWCSWIDDANTARMLNIQPRQLTANDFKAYVRGFDRIEHHALGIFRKGDQRLVGIWAVYVDWERSEFLLNVIVGDIPERKTFVRHETAWRLNRYFFEELDLKFQRANALATNVPAVRSLEEKNWTLSSRGFALGADGSPQVEILHYTRSRDVWRQGTPTTVEELYRGAGSSG